MSVLTHFFKKDRKQPSNSMLPPSKTPRKWKMQDKKLTVLGQNKMVPRSPMRKRCSRCPRKLSNWVFTIRYGRAQTRFKAPVRILREAANVASILKSSRLLSPEWSFVIVKKPIRKPKSASERTSSKIKSYWTNSKRTLSGKRRKLWNFKSASASSRAKFTSGIGIWSKRSQSIRVQARKLVWARLTSQTILVGKSVIGQAILQKWTTWCRMNSHLLIL